MYPSPFRYLLKRITSELPVGFQASFPGKPQANQVWKHPMCWIRAWAPQGVGWVPGRKKIDRIQAEMDRGAKTFSFVF